MRRVGFQIPVMCRLLVNLLVVCGPERASLGSNLALWYATVRSRLEGI